MKITTDALIFRIWLEQLKTLSERCVHTYVGDRFGVCPDSWFTQTSGIHIMRRTAITQKIGQQQLRKRIISLIDQGFLRWGHQNSTFLIDTPLAHEAFLAARKYMLQCGIPEGWDDKNRKMKTVELSPDEIKSYKNECCSFLLENYRQIDFSNLYNKVYESQTALN